MAKFGGGIEVKNTQDFEEELTKLIRDKVYYAQKSELNKAFVETRIGATELIYNHTC